MKELRNIEGFSYPSLDVKSHDKATNGTQITVYPPMPEPAHLVTPGEPEVAVELPKTKSRWA